MLDLVKMCVSIIFLLLFSALRLAYCGDFIEDKVCGTIYSKSNFQGDEFILKDFDQSVNTRKDYRASDSGWSSSGSIRVEEGCKMSICSSTYFQGRCHNVTPDGSITEALLNSINSVKCSCSQNCSCDDIFIPKETFGRAYLSGGCSACNAEYVELSSSGGRFTEAGSKDCVRSLVLRKGCRITIKADADDAYEGESKTFENEIVENLVDSVASYTINCTESAFVSRVEQEQTFFSPMIDPPKTERDLLSMLSYNESMGNHPGMKAVLESFESGRSVNSAYVLVIGNFDISAMLHPSLKSCRFTTSVITDCQLGINLDEIGISHSQLRVINVQLFDERRLENNRGYHYSRQIDYDEDYTQMATLKSYLSRNKELQNIIPNVVIFVISVEKDQNILERKLRVLNAFRMFVLDETRSNLVFLVKYSDAPEDTESLLNGYETRISKILGPPTPYHLIPVEWQPKIKVNGYWKMHNKEYFPRNLQQKMLQVTKKAGDGLGHAILKTVFEHEHDQYKASFQWVPKVLSDQDIEDEFNQLRASTYITKMFSVSLKQEQKLRRMMIADTVKIIRDVESRQNNFST